MPEMLRRQITDNLEELLTILPEALRTKVVEYGHLDQLVEIVLDLGRLPEARYFDSAHYLSDVLVSANDLHHCIEQVGSFGSDNRAGIERTLHRISAIRNRKGSIIGLTCRVGRAIYGSSELIRDLVETGKSILLLGKPGMGKTTALREIARILADELSKRVVIIDTSNEIAGDGDIPHPAIGRSRRMQVARPELQHQVMIEAVENHMPQVIVIDEIGTELESLAARTIAERGVQLIGTAHGNELANLIKNPTLSDLVGGIQSVTLGDDEARRRGTQKSVLERKAAPTFEIAVEMLERYRWIVHPNVAESIDTLLRGREVARQIRSVTDTGKVHIVQELPKGNDVLANPHAKGWRSTGRMQPLPPDEDLFEEEEDYEEDFSDFTPAFTRGLPNDVCYVYLYGVSRHLVEQVSHTLQLPIVFSKDIDSAHMVLALRSHGRNNTKLRQLIDSRALPVHMIKSNTLPQVTRALRRMVHIDESSSDIQDFAYGDSEDQLEALEEARLAVEQIVIPKGQAVELLPRSSTIRRMQHELVERYHLRSDSFGEEPNRRLRIYPL